MGFLDRELSDIRHDIDVLRCLTKWIIIIGIMLILISDAIILPFLIVKESLILKQEVEVEKSKEGKEVQNTFFENTLVGIFQIIGKVGMLVVTDPGEPLSKAPFFVLWNFGADQCASSEGFLVTFIPRAQGGFKFFLGFNPRERWERIHFVRILPEARRLAGIYPVLVRCSSSPSTLKDREVTSAGTRAYPALGERQRRSGKRIRTPPPLEENLGKDLMNPRAQGVLVALNPTDEGRIGTGRNT